MKLTFRNKPDNWRQLGDDALLLSYSQTGNMDIIGELFHRYGYLVFGVCLKYLKNEEEANDACMQVFEKLITELRTTHVIQFKAWLHTVARNHCLLHIRKTISEETHRIRYEKIFSEDFMEFWTEMNHIHDADNEMKKLYKALDTLEVEQRQCLELIYFHDKSYKQISEIIGFDTNKVKSCIQNGKRNLKIILEREHEE